MAGIQPGEYRPEVLEFVYQSWTIEVRPYPEGGYFARVVELPGCMTEADTAADVLDSLEEARAEWISAALELGQTIPEPLRAAEYSGRIFIRTSSQLHRLVVEAAAKEGVSMSQWASEILAREVGVLSSPTGRLSPEAMVDLLEALRLSIGVVDSSRSEESVVREVS
ncbi:MAG: toxin-antitoxin system HicB family antitoxin [Actinomycetota bacterium]